MDTRKKYGILFVALTIALLYFITWFGSEINNEYWWHAPTMFIGIMGNLGSLGLSFYFLAFDEPN